MHRLKLLGLAISGSMVLLQLWSVLMSDAHVTTGPLPNHVFNLVVNHELKYEGLGELPCSCPSLAEGKTPPPPESWSVLHSPQLWRDTDVKRSEN